MRVNPVLAGMTSYPFLRLIEAKQRGDRAWRRRHRLRHRRAARGDARPSSRARSSGRSRTSRCRPTRRPRGCPSCARRSPAGRRAASAPPLDPATEIIPTPGSKEAIFTLRAGLRRPRRPRRRDRPRLSGGRTRGALRRRIGGRGAARSRARLAAGPRRRRLGRRRAAVAELPQQPDGGHGRRSTSTSAPPRWRASTTSSSPSTRRTPSCGSRATRRSAPCRCPTARNVVVLQHALQALVDARLPLRASRPATPRSSRRCGATARTSASRRRPSSSAPPWPRGATTRT